MNGLFIVAGGGNNMIVIVYYIACYAGPWMEHGRYPVVEARKIIRLLQKNGQPAKMVKA